MSSIWTNLLPTGSWCYFPSFFYTYHGSNKLCVTCVKAITFWLVQVRETFRSSSKLCTTIFDDDSRKFYESYFKPYLLTISLVLLQHRAHYPPTEMAQIYDDVHQLWLNWKWSYRSWRTIFEAYKTWGKSH